MTKNIRILTYNTHSCTGTDRRLDPARIADVITRCKPDIVGLQELDLGRARTGSTDQADIIAGFLGMKSFFHPALHKAEEKYGDAILTALPMRTRKAAAIPSIGEPRGAIWVEVDIDDTPLHVFNTHLGLRRRERLQQVSTLLGSQWLNHRDCRDAPRVFMGDLNAIPSSPAYRQLARGMTDIWQHTGNKPKATFHSRYPLMRLDHIFLSDGLKGVNAHVVSTPLSRIASDHLPLVAEIEFANKT